MSVAIESLSKAQARVLTNEVKADAEKLWFKLLRLYDGGAHLTLGYSSWGDYFEAEFGGSKSRGYQILEAARVVDALGHSTFVEPPNEAQARELAPLLTDPAAMNEAWEEAVETTNGQPTAAVVKTVVKRKVISEEGRQEIISLRLQGKRIAEIAKLTGWSPAAISKVTSKPKPGRLPRRQQAGSNQTRALARINQTCREWETLGDEDYIPAPELARRIRILDAAVAFLTNKRDTYKEVAPNGRR